MTLDEANALGDAEFVARFGGVFEHSTWIAARVAPLRPFASIIDLHAAMCAQVEAAGDVAQLALLCAHPELSGKAAVAGTITEQSAREQDAAGLLHCSHAEFAALRRMNVAYRERFGFPFIVAVRGMDRVGILARLEERLGNDRDTEFAEALRQVERIAALRLEALLAG
ncbi:MAG: 2-oxo-4-hydroxy-4-carboxy-5-ureidoimidazoline decarboxylase [Arenimonas sp.]